MCLFLFKVLAYCMILVVNVGLNTSSIDCSLQLSQRLPLVREAPWGLIQLLVSILFFWGKKFSNFVILWRLHGTWVAECWGHFIFLSVSKWYWKKTSFEQMCTEVSPFSHKQINLYLIFYSLTKSNPSEEWLRKNKSIPVLPRLSLSSS